MDNQTEQFEKLVTLMKLKRYEAPPPGYFDRFSDQVLARIEVLSQRQPSWFERFILSLGDRPALSASCGALMGAVLVGSFLLSQPEGQPDSALFGDTGVHGLKHPSTRAYLDPIFQPGLATLVSGASNSTKPFGLAAGDLGLREPHISFPFPGSE